MGAQTQTINSLRAERQIGVAWLRRLAIDFTDAIRLSSLSLGGKRNVDMDGQAKEFKQTPEAAVSEFTFWLEDTNRCKDVRLGSSRRSETEGGMVAFNLKCRVGAGG